MFTALALGSASALADGVCAEMKAKMARVYGSISDDHCTDLTRLPSLDGNPFVYTNPDAGCDLGLSMPGLPGFGLSGGDFSWCGVAKAVTGGMVNEANAAMQGATNEAVGAVDQISVDTIGVQASGGVNVGSVIKKGYDNVGAPAGEMPSGVIN